MPKIEYPRSDQARIDLLESCIHNAKSCLNTEEQILSKDYIHELENLYHPYKSLYTKLSSLTANAHKSNRAKQNSIQELNLIIRDFYEVLRRRARRKKYPPAVFTMYGLKHNGHNPKLNKQNEIMDAARLIIAGDKYAVSLSYQAMQNPSAREVFKLLKKAENDLANTLPSERGLEMYQHEIRDFRQQADELIRETSAQLRFALRKNSPSNQRRMMRHYGFSYRYTKHENEHKD